MEKKTLIISLFVVFALPIPVTMRGKNPDFDFNPLAVILVLLAIYYLLPTVLYGIRYALAERLHL